MGKVSELRCVSKREQKMVCNCNGCPKKKLGIDVAGIIDILNVKCDPVLIGSLRMGPGFLPAYHMNKDKWISILLDGSVPDDEMKNFIDLSYKMTEAKKKQ